MKPNTNDQHDKALRNHCRGLEESVATAILAEAKHTDALSREDGADTKHAYPRLDKAIGRHATPDEQEALARCISVLDAADEVS